MGHAQQFQLRGYGADRHHHHYGQDRKIHVSAEQYAALRKAFFNRTVPIGASRTSADADSLGTWLQANVTPVAIASYVGPILLEGYAERVGNTHIRIVR